MAKLYIFTQNSNTGNYSKLEKNKEVIFVAEYKKQVVQLFDQFQEAPDGTWMNVKYISDYFHQNEINHLDKYITGIKVDRPCMFGILKGETEYIKLAEL